MQKASPPFQLTDAHVVALKAFIAENTDTDAAYAHRHDVSTSLTRSTFPSVDGIVNLIASKYYLTDSMTDLLKLVKVHGFSTDLQQRRPIAMVQTSGFGKTRAAIQLTQYDHVVLPICFSDHHLLLRVLKDWQNKHVKEMEQRFGNGQLSALDLHQFAVRCVDMVELMILSILKLFTHLCRDKVDFQCDRSHLHALAVMLWMQQSDLTQWCKDWFLRKADITAEHDQFSDYAGRVYIEAVAAATSKHIVILLDEVHVAQEICINHIPRFSSFSKESNGHSDGNADASADADAELLHQWFQSRGKVAGDNNRTNLLYQMRRFMGNHLERPKHNVVFIMTSTMFSAWQSIDHPNKSRGFELAKFTSLQPFDLSHLQQLIQHWFNISDKVITSAAPDLWALRRPLLAARLIEQLMGSVGDMTDYSEPSLQQWINTTAQSIYNNAIAEANTRIRNLLRGSISTKYYTAIELITTLYACYRLRHGTVGKEDDSVMQQLLHCGVVALDRKGGYTYLADKIYIDAVSAQFNQLEDRNEQMLEWLSKVFGDARMSVKPHIADGFGMERVLLWLALNKQLKILIQGNEHTVECVADTGGYYEELRINTNEATLHIAIALGKVKVVLMPSFQAGPDLWFLATIAGRDALIAIQSKCLKTALTWSTFDNALSSLDPQQMFTSKNADAIARNIWTESRSSILNRENDNSNDNDNDIDYYRIVFSKNGVKPYITEFLDEYNAANRPLLLGEQRVGHQYTCVITMDDLRTALGSHHQIIAGKINERDHLPSNRKRNIDDSNRAFSDYDVKF